MARIRHLVDDFCSTNGITVRQLDTDIMAYVRDDLDLLGQLVRRLGFDPSSTRIPIFGTPLASQSSDLSNRSKSSRKTYAGATDSSRRRSAIPPVPPKTPPPLEQWNNNKIIIIDERDAQDHDYFGDYLPKIVSRLRDLLLLPENTTKYLVALRGDASLHPPNSKEGIYPNAQCYPIPLSFRY